VLGLAGGALALAFMPQPVPVDETVVRKGQFTMVKTGIARTRVVDRYVVAAPVPGHLARISLRAGDQVAAGQVIAHLDAITSAPMDARTRAEWTARMRAAQAAENEARMAIERARILDQQAQRDLERTRALATGQALPQARLEEVEALALTRSREVSLADLAAGRLRREVEVTKAALTDLKDSGARGRISVRAPTSGRVLRIITQSEGPVAAGTPLVELGDPASLEIVVELPTPDAVVLKPNAPVEFVRWGGREPLAGRVRLVEPSAFTKLTALGIEEQRVNVIVEPLRDARWGTIGDGFQFDARITAYQRPDATILPVGATFRDGSGWAVLAVSGGRARKRTVTLGEKGDSEVEIREGLAPDETVILYPGDQVVDGQRVRAR
jgi:HlyD family secretion protein